MKTLYAWVCGIAFVAIFFGALHITSVPGASEEQRTADYKSECIKAAKQEFARRKLAGLTDDANRMMYPVGQAKIK